MASNPAALISEAAQHHAEGRFREAESALRLALEAEPESPPALLLLGVVLAKLERLDEAAKLLEQVCALDASSFQARLWMSIVARRLGRSDEALKYAKQAVGLNPKDAQALNQLGSANLDLRDFRSASDCFTSALALAPGVAQIHFGLGQARQGLRDGVGAIAAFRQAGRLAPTSVAVQMSVRQSLMDENDPAGAADAARAILKAHPQSAEAHLWLARALLEDNKPKEAEPLIHQAMALDADGGLAYTLLGSTSQILGDITAAESYFKKSIEAAPNQGSAYMAFTSNRKMTETDRPVVDKMISLLGEQSMSENHLSQLHFGIGKALEDLGEYGDAMAHFEEANRLAHDHKFGHGRFDRGPLRQSYDFAIEKYDRKFLADNRGCGSDRDLPIFVVGMMRSGTTLAEQVLSSHPEVGAAGEQRFWSDHRNSALSRSGESIERPAIKELTAKYYSLLQRVSRGKDRVVDKMPVNYEVVGLIHLAFPNAKIVHTRRNPMDTAISIYTTPNRSRIEWTHDKADIVFVYQQYLRLMEHWRAVLPKGVMIEVDYEDMVADRERTTRELIAFCGLPWDDACLSPEKNDRSVVTPSVWQVRQPVYRTSMERWRKYEPWLGPFAKLAPKGLVQSS